GFPSGKYTLHRSFLGSGQFSCLEPECERAANPRCLAYRSLQRNTRKEAYPTRLETIRTGMTIGGTNQPFMACLLCRMVLFKPAQLAPAASATSRAQSASPERFAPRSDVSRYARIPSALAADECRTTPAPPAGTTRTRPHGCRRCQAPGRTPLQV